MAGSWIESIVQPSTRGSPRAIPGISGGLGSLVLVRLLDQLTQQLQPFPQQLNMPLKDLGDALKDAEQSWIGHLEIQGSAQPVDLVSQLVHLPLEGHGPVAFVFRDAKGAMLGLTGCAELLSECQQLCIALIGALVMW